jgi:hypothetical protein
MARGAHRISTRKMYRCRVVQEFILIHLGPGDNRRNETIIQSSHQVLALKLEENLSRLRQRVILVEKLR